MRFGIVPYPHRANAPIITLLCTDIMLLDIFKGRYVLRDFFDYITHKASHNEIKSNSLLLVLVS